jgi:hypothetical protein
MHLFCLLFVFFIASNYETLLTAKSWLSGFSSEKRFTSKEAGTFIGLLWPTLDSKNKMPAAQPPRSTKLQYFIANCLPFPLFPFTSRHPTISPKRPFIHLPKVLTKWPSLLPLFTFHVPPLCLPFPRSLPSAAALVKNVSSAEFVPPSVPQILFALPRDWLVIREGNER